MSNAKEKIKEIATKEQKDAMKEMFRMDDKYDPHAHKRYRYIVDKRNWKRLHKNPFDFERYLKNGCEPYTPDEDTGAEFTAWKWAAWKKSRKGLLGKLLNR